MPYAVMSNGAFRAVLDRSDLEEGETFYDDVPQWAYDAIAAADDLRVKTLAETEWRTAEMEFIGNQLTAIEDEDPAALPGTAKQWRDYRIKVRAWVEGAENYPDIEHRPVRPE